MPRGFFHKIAAQEAFTPYAEFNATQPGLVVTWPVQESPGATVALATNDALALATRSVALLTYGDYVAGANWANSSGQIARHTAGAVETLQQDDILAAGKTYQVTITVANRTAGSVTITNGGAAISANEEAIRTITSTGTDFIITPTTDFDGDIDVAIILVQQTNILASSAFPGAELLTNPGAPFTFTTDDPDDWDVVGEVASDPEITERDSGQVNAGTSIIGGSCNLFSSSDVFLPIMRKVGLVGVGIRYKTQIFLSALASGQCYYGDTLSGFEITTDIGLSEHEFVGTAGNYSIQGWQLALPNNFTVDWASLKEANPFNGDVTGLVFGVASGTQLGSFVSSDGINDNLSVDSAELNSSINFDNLSFDMWAQADTWAAGTDYLFRFEIDANNDIAGYRDGTDLVLSHIAGGTTKTVTIASGSPTGKFHIGISVDIGGDVMTGIYNGLPGGTATSLGTMVGNLSSDKTAIGASDDSGSNSWAGDWTQPSLFNITLDNGAWIERYEAGGVS